MPWALTATKQGLKSFSTSKQKDLIEKRAKKLKDAGFRVRVYEIKRAS